MKALRSLAAGLFITALAVPNLLTAESTRADAEVYIVETLRGLKESAREGGDLE